MRQYKLRALDDKEACWSFAQIERGDLDNFRPTPFLDVEALSLEECFWFAGGGDQTARDDIVYSPVRGQLALQVAAFQALGDDEAKKVFGPTKRRPLEAARTAQFDDAAIRRIAFRPLDTRYLYADDRFVEYMRSELIEAWGPENVCLYAMPFGTGNGVSIWLHGLYPDYQALSERGGYAFPLYDRRQGPDAANLSTILLAHLGEAYGAPVRAEDVFDAILALLSATSYTRRFAEDLEDTFPHIPFPAAREVFDRTVTAGREIRAIETFSREPLPQFRPGTLARIESQPAGVVRGGLTSDGAWNEGEVTLCADGSGRLSGIPRATWDFAVSGYRVLPRWIDGRKGLPADLPLIREFRDVAARIGELIHRFDEADLVLAETLADTLTRAELGFGTAPMEQAADGDD